MDENIMESSSQDLLEDFIEETSINETSEQTLEVSSGEFASEVVGEDSSEDETGTDLFDDNLNVELSETEEYVVEIVYDDTTLLEMIQEQNTLLQYQNTVLSAVMFALMFIICDRFISRSWSHIRSIGGGR